MTDPQLFHPLDTPPPPPPPPVPPAPPIDSPPPPAGRQANRLDRAHARRLEAWIDEHWQTIERTPPTQRTLAKKATACLGFDVTKGNVRGAVVALGRTWPASPQRATFPAVDAVRRDTRTVAAALCQFARSLGYRLDPAVEALASQAAAQATVDRDTPPQPAEAATDG